MESLRFDCPVFPEGVVCHVSGSCDYCSFFQNHKLSTAVQLSLFDVTPPAQHAAQGRRKGPSAELRQQRGEGTPTIEIPFDCPLGRDRCIARPHDCELWQYFCVSP